MDFYMWRESHREYRLLKECKKHPFLYKYYFGMFGDRRKAISSIVEKRAKIQYPLNIRKEVVEFLEFESNLIVKGWKQIPYVPKWLYKSFPPLIQV